MEMQLITIDPDMAQTLLDRNFKNRPVKVHRLKQYSDAMRDGQWQVNGESIKIYSDGTLADGQHRLRACILAGVPFSTYVVNDLPRDAHATLDIGANRSNADHIVFQYGFEGKDAQIVASGSTLILAHDFGLESWAKRSGINSTLATPTRVQKWVEDNFDLAVDMCDFTRDLTRIKPNLITPAYVFALAILFGRSSVKVANAYLTEVETGHGIEAGSNSDHIRNHLMRQLTARQKPPVEQRIYSVCRGFNSTLAGRTVVHPGNLLYRRADSRPPIYEGFGSLKTN